MRLRPALPCQSPRSPFSSCSWCPGLWWCSGVRLPVGRQSTRIDHPDWGLGVLSCPAVIALSTRTLTQLSVLIRRRLAG